MAAEGPVPIEVGLDAVILAVTDETPRVLTIRASGASLDALPSGSLDPVGDRTLDLGLRRWVREQTGIELGYLEQLYTFGDRGRDRTGERRLLSIAYLALALQQAVYGPDAPAWNDVYAYLPWEDWRRGEPALLRDVVRPGLDAWVRDGSDEGEDARQARAEIAFGWGTSAWDPLRVLDRYELLYDAGLVGEAAAGAEGVVGMAMALDHRRMVALALERLRGKLSYRPVVFELLPETFTLLQLQRLVEALGGVRLHKPNFRRLVEQGQLVERTGELEQPTRGRPAELVRFRREVLRERPAPGVALPRRITR